MRISFKNLGAAGILVAGTAFAGISSAATIVQNQLVTFGEAPASVAVSAGNTDNNTNQQTLSFGSISKFNTGLGILNSVTFNISWVGEVEFSRQELDPATNYSVFNRSTVTFRADGSTDSVSATADAGQTVVGHPFFNIGAVAALDIAGGGTFSETDAGFLAAFSGPGSIASTIELENFVELTVTAGGSIQAATRGCPLFGSLICGVNSGNFFPAVRGSLMVTYDYSESVAQIPAPGGIALLALGLIGVGAVRRRVR